MSIQKPERVEFIRNLSDLIDSASSRADILLKNLGWSKEKIFDSKEDRGSLLQCPVNEDHSVMSSRLEEHVRSCKLKTSGFCNVPAKDLPDSCKFFYQSQSSSVNQVVIGKHELNKLGLYIKRQKDTTGIKDDIQRQVLINEEAKLKNEEENSKETDDPKLSSEAEFNLPANYLETLLNSEDRLKLYEYVTETGKAMKQGKEVSFDELEQDAIEQQRVLEMQERLDDERPKTKMEALAELRDYKRRRQSYRAKNPILSKTSATMVIRELIDQQMKYLEIVSNEKSKNGDGIVESRLLDETVQGAIETNESVDRVKQNFADNDGDFSEKRHRERKDNERYRDVRESRQGRSRDRRERSRSRERYQDYNDRGERREVFERRERHRDRRRDDFDRSRERENTKDRDRGDYKDEGRYKEGMYRRALQGKSNETDEKLKLEIAQGVKDIREGFCPVDELTRCGNDRDTEQEDLGLRQSDDIEASDNEKRRKRHKRRSSRSLSRSRSRSKERHRHKHKKHKEKSKKKKHKRNDDYDEDEDDEWVERTCN